jgi:hypothetical protein
MTTTANPPRKIRIADLRHPVLTDLQIAVLAEARQNPPSMRVADVLAEARAQTGLDDFGPMDFVERMGIWLADGVADTDLTAFGRAAIYRTCVGFAATRLKAHALLEAHPEIHELEVEAPVIVVGLPRSGTTHLVNLLAADSRRRSLPYWEACEPIADTSMGTQDGPDPRWLRSAAKWDGLKKLLPLMQQMHPFDPDHIHEDLELQGPDFSSYYPEWLCRSEQWRSYYLSHDQTPTYGYLRTMLKILQWQRGPSSWVLKCPQHLEQLGPLMRTFPDAKVVFTYRDPLAVLQSAATMSSYTGRLRYEHLDIDYLLQHWADRIEQLLRAAVRDMHLVPAEQRFDVHFSDLQNNDLGLLESMYEHFGIPMPDDIRSTLQRFLIEHPRGRDGSIVYDLRADFGVDPATLGKRFAFYMDAFGVRSEFE